MKTREEGELPIDIYFRESDLARRVKLEEAILGPRQFRLYAGPLAVSALSGGTMLILAKDQVLDAPSLCVLGALLVCGIAWSAAESAFTNRRINALKEYIDFRLEERDDDR
ncbi:hypothetical protein BH09VER1_BH09VER1_44620 [soil metagenome]